MKLRAYTIRRMDAQGTLVSYEYEDTAGENIDLYTVTVNHPAAADAAGNLLAEAALRRFILARRPDREVALRKSFAAAGTAARIAPLLESSTSVADADVAAADAAAQTGTAMRN